MQHEIKMVVFDLKLGVPLGVQPVPLLGSPLCVPFCIPLRISFGVTEFRSPFQMTISQDGLYIIQRKGP